MYLKKIVIAVLLIGLVVAGIFAYMIYNAVFSPNTNFNEREAYVYIPTNASLEDVKDSITPLLEDFSTFMAVADRKGYSNYIKSGKYRIAHGMNNNEIINSLRSRNIPVKVSFNNQETLASLAGRISQQIEPDSIALLTSFNDSQFIKNNSFNKDTKLGMYLPNSYEFFWNTNADEFRDRMLVEYKKFWNNSRLDKAKAIGLNDKEISVLASIVHKETAKVDERPRVAGVYLNRLRNNIPLQADPTVIFALKSSTGNFDTIIKRVLYKDLKIDSPFNTYKYAGLPPGPITMPDITAIDAVLNAEKHEFYYFVANVEKFGYHKFAKTLAQHNRNKVQYIRWLNSQKINR